MVERNSCFAYIRYTLCCFLCGCGSRYSRKTNTDDRQGCRLFCTYSSLSCSSREGLGSRLKFLDGLYSIKPFQY
jgi:alpha-D-ribose 1-methylphosphonate 5-phosphate C-P lyase